MSILWAAPHAHVHYGPGAGAAHELWWQWHIDRGTRLVKWKWRAVWSSGFLWFVAMALWFSYWLVGPLPFSLEFLGLILLVQGLLVSGAVLAQWAGSVSDAIVASAQRTISGELAATLSPSVADALRQEVIRYEPLLRQVYRAAGGVARWSPGSEENLCRVLAERYRMLTAPPPTPPSAAPPPVATPP